VDDLSAVAALVLYAAGTAALLAALSLQQMRSTGGSGFRRLTSMRLRRAERAGRLCFGLAALAGLLSPLLAAVHVLPVYGHREGTLRQNELVGALDWVGLVGAAGGIAVAFLTLHIMGSVPRTGVDPADRSAQAARGILAVIRNPVFTAQMALQAGTALIAPTSIAVAGVAAAVLACQIQTRLVEEPYLLALHGSAYRSYAARTGRFLPWLGSLPAVSLPGEPALH
jgi:protein-S-isoprenylcysteine O-methyltransferase Ste14